MSKAWNSLKVEDIRNELIVKFGSNIEILEIIDSRNITIKSNVCGHIIKRNIFDLRENPRKIRCTECTHKDRRHLKLTEESFYIKYPNFAKEYEIVGNWIDSQSKTMIRHKLCGFTWEVIPYNIGRGTIKGCPKCGGCHTKYNTHVVKQLLEDTDFKLLTECNTKADNATFKHETCGHVFEKRVGAFMNYHSCPNCFVRSHGESLIKKTLESHNIEFKQEVAFKDLRGVRGGYLRYDFAIYRNGKLDVFIEYDGPQHEKEVDLNFFRNNFDIIKEHDKRKTEYCQRNNYTLLRIPHSKRRTANKVVEKFLIKNMLIPSQAL
ncbi:MAG: hypothetical protein ACRDA3_13095 [Peptostreptococcaceae bacterium]